MNFSFNFKPRVKQPQQRVPINQQRVPTNQRQVSVIDVNKFSALKKFWTKDLAIPKDEIKTHDNTVAEEEAAAKIAADEEAAAEETARILEEAAAKETARVLEEAAKVAE